MKKTTYSIILLNVFFSTILFADKWLLSGSNCTTCQGLPISHLLLSLFSLLGALIILGLYTVALKHRHFMVPWLVFNTFTATVSSMLIGYQLQLGHIVCWLCFMSEILYYLVFIAIIHPLLFSWIRLRLTD